MSLRNLPEKWEKNKFSECLDIQGGSQPPKKYFSEIKKPGYVRLYQIRDLGDNPIPVYVDTKRVTKFCEDKDILIGRYGASVGKVFWGRKGAYNVALVKVLFNHSIFQKPYLYYFFKSGYFQQCLSKISKTAQNGFNKTDLSRILVPIAPLNEQQHIVSKIEELFSNLNEAENIIKQTQKLLKQYKQSVLKAAITGELTREWREVNKNRLESGKEFLKRILKTRRDQWQGRGKYQEPKALDTNKLPKLSNEWIWVSIEQCAFVETGATPKRGEIRYYKNGTIPWITSGAVNVEYIENYAELITEKAIEETNAKLFLKGSLIMAMYGEGKTRGKIAELNINAATNQACAAILCHHLDDDIKKYIKIFFYENYSKMRKRAAGGVQPNLNLSMVKNTLVPLPSFEELKQINIMTNNFLANIKMLGREIKTIFADIKALRQSILKAAFSGQLVSQNPNDEPATELLKKIKNEVVSKTQTKRRKVKSGDNV